MGSSSLATLVATLLAAALVLSCSADLGPPREIAIWAQYVSLHRQAGFDREGGAADRELERFESIVRDRYGLSPGDLEALADRGERLGWVGWRGCRPAPRPYHQLGGLGAPPLARSPLVPNYPEAARKAGVEGVVVLRAVITAEGTVDALEILRGLPLGMTESASETLLASRWHPALLCGRPVNVYFTVALAFRLRDATGEVRRE